MNAEDIKKELQGELEMEIKPTKVSVTHSEDQKLTDVKTKAGFVAIVGRPNAGKSTLLNKILKSPLSIVSRKAQTTRERLFGILTETDRQIVFVDTPGIHKAKEHSINEFMVSEAKSALDDQQIVWYLVDPSSELEHEEVVMQMLRKSRPEHLFLIMNKQDMRTNPELVATLSDRLKELGVGVQGTYSISARQSKGVTELLHSTWALIPESPFYFSDPEQISDRPTRYFISEKIREQLLLHLGDELPYSCAIEIETYNEKKKPLQIEAIIYVERESQKGMVIGKGGTKIKQIGIGARKTAEEFLSQPIYLGLKVKVLEGWTKDPIRLKRLGYHIPNHSKKSKNKPRGVQDAASNLNSR